MKLYLSVESDGANSTEIARMADALRVLAEGGALASIDFVINPDLALETGDGKHTEQPLYTTEDVVKAPEPVKGPKNKGPRSTKKAEKPAVEQATPSVDDTIAALHAYREANSMIEAKQLLKSFGVSRLTEADDETRLKIHAALTA